MANAAGEEQQAGTTKLFQSLLAKNLELAKGFEPPTA
jgi:hypothetical protein